MLWTVAVLLFFVAVGYTVYALTFLARNLNAAFTRDQGLPGAATKFNFEALEPLIAAGKLERR